MDQYTLFQHFQRCYSQKFLCFTGRSRRREFWGFALYYGLATLATMLLLLGASFYTLYANSSVMLYVTIMLWGVLQLYQVASLLPLLAVTTRRLHDVGRAGWWQLIAYIPALLLLVFYVWMTHGLSPLLLVVLVSSGATGVLWLGGILLALTLVGVITLLVFLGRRGEQAENSYGLNPELDVEEEQEEHSFSMN